MVSFAQFKKRENTHGAVLLLVKYQAKPATLLKSNTPPWVFSRFLNYLNGTKSRNASQLIPFNSLHIRSEIRQRCLTRAEFNLSYRLKTSCALCCIPTKQKPSEEIIWNYSAKKRRSYNFIKKETSA